jgi:hypothetical protein
MNKKHNADIDQKCGKPTSTACPSSWFWRPGNADNLGQGNQEAYHDRSVLAF